MSTARDYGERIVHERSRTGNSGHFYIERNGRAEEWVPPDRVAHHVRGFNERSIGIELDNPGRYPCWFHSAHQDVSEPYSLVQLENLVRLLHSLRAAIPTLKYISGHEHLDRERIRAEDDPEVWIRRKIDPGPLFPWSRIVATTGLALHAPSTPSLRAVNDAPPR